MACDALLLGPKLILKLTLSLLKERYSEGLWDWTSYDVVTCIQDKSAIKINLNIGTVFYFYFI